jgi:type II secretory pathway component PulF
LGTLLKSGIPIDESITITADTVPNFYYQRALKRTVIRIKKGGSLAMNLSEEKNLFPKLVTGMVNVGEQSGKLDKMLLYMSVFYENEVNRSTKTFTTVLEPVLLVIIGVVVGTIALSIITPIYEITGNLGATR